MKRNIAVSESLESAGNDFVKYAMDLNLMLNTIKNRVQEVTETLESSVRIEDYGFYLNTLQDANDFAILLKENGDKLLDMSEQALVCEHFPSAFRRKERDFRGEECDPDKHNFKVDFCDDAMLYCCTKCGKKKKLMLFSKNDI